MDPSKDDDHYIDRDPSNNEFDCVVGAFQASMLCYQILLDEIHVPVDGCVGIAKAIEDAMGKAVSDE